MLCDDRNFVVGVLGKKKSCGEARDASTGARSAHVTDNERVDKPDHDNVWHSEKTGRAFQTT